MADEVTASATPITPGYRTTEFWLSLVAIVLGTLASSGMIADGSTAMRVVGLAMTVLAALGYTAGRAKVKTA